ncbi:MAG: cysteine--tRNA ligase [Calditrichia bacterium]|nr:cysteine--tRNA ligase [Calditrichia bacterium]
MDTLYIYNTLSRKKEKFEPITPGFVGIYVCGPTVYDHSHVGHAKSYISFDVIVRYLRYLGYKVKYVQNLTDVGHLLGDSEEGEDKITKKARLEKLEPMEVAEFYARSYFEDMDILGNIRPDISPRASGHIIEQIDMIRMLIDKGLAYETGGNVYFDVRKFPEYGKLSGRKIEELEAGVRVEVAEDKKHPADFALWKKAAPEHLMKWNSPWGKGYPGWHIECSSMSTKYLGETFDIHGGGLENIFPHHECEIAQSEGTFDKPFVKYWMHNNMVTVDSVKMGKSLKNFITIKDAVKRYMPLAIRYFILMSHYRSSLDFSEKALDAATTGLKKIQNFMVRIQDAIASVDETSRQPILPLEKFENNFRAAMNDDFNTAQALAATFDIISEVNKILDDKKNQPGKSELQQLQGVMKKTLGDVLGLISREHAESKTSGEDFDHLMDVLLDVRSDLRKEKNFQIADKIRDGLGSIGVSIKDTPDGASWEKE